MLLTGRLKWTDVWHYFMGHYRYLLYYSPRFSRLMRKHIREQIDFRIKVMNPLCYNQGSCIICGCETTALQMASKSCDKPCYPPLMSKKLWKRFFKERKYVAEDKKGKRVWIINYYTGKPDLFTWNKETNSYNEIRYNV